MKTKVTSEILTGRTSEHVQKIGDGALIHAGMVKAFQQLSQRALQDGFELKIVSGFRDRDAQLRIWNQKATGQRDLLDEKGRKLDFRQLGESEIIHAILRWSALPGASRHHWGTDVDVVDGKRLSSGYRVRLVPEEAEPGGPFFALNEWLSTHLSDFDFFRPYAVDRGGVSPEWWHISYAPISQVYFEAHHLELLRETITGAALELKSKVLADLSDLYERYVRNITFP